MRKFLGIILTILSALTGTLCVVSALQLSGGHLQSPNRDFAYRAGGFVGRLLLPFITGAITYYLYEKGQDLVKQPAATEE